MKFKQEIHFWEFNKNYCIKLDEVFMRELLKLISFLAIPYYKIAKLIGIDETTLREIRQRPTKLLQIKTILKIVAFLEKYDNTFNKKEIESHIIFIGPGVGKGITNPKLPFQIKNPNFVRILAASFGDGTLTNPSYYTSEKYKLGVFEYTNEDQELRERLINSSITIFGGKKEEYVVRPSKKSISLYFPVIIRDAVLMAGGIKGEKSIHNPGVPTWVINSRAKNLYISWLQQTFDDEGSVRFRKNYNHEVFITRVVDITNVFSKNFNYGKKVPFGQLLKKEQIAVLNNPPYLLVDESKMLKTSGIESRLKPQEIYITKKGKLKAKWRLYITKKDNLKNFAKIIGFTNQEKKNILKAVIGEKIEIQTKNKRKKMECKAGKDYMEKLGKKQNIQVQRELKKEKFHH